MKKICIITGSRSDFGLLKNLIIKMRLTQGFVIKVIASGSHFFKSHGYTFNEIKKSKIKVDKKIKYNFFSNEPIDIAKIFSKSLIESMKILKKINPDIILVLGDRYEILASVLASNLLRIPVGHIHGGEVTLGSLDDAFRHSITKMAHIHFCANEDYRKRIIQLGENPKNIHVVGGLGVDSIHQTKFLSKKQLENKFKFKFLKNNFLVCLHPESIQKNLTLKHIKVLLSALENIKDTIIIFTNPGADSENYLITKEIKKFIKKNKKNFLFFKSLGQLNYFSFLRHVDGIIGNSSSGILEAPYFNIGTINIGLRQFGRVKSDSVLNCKFEKKKIIKLINLVLSNNFKKKLVKIKKNYPYGKEGASDKIIKILLKKNLKNIFIKRFCDLKRI